VDEPGTGAPDDGVPGKLAGGVCVGTRWVGTDVPPFGNVPGAVRVGASPAVSRIDCGAAVLCVPT